jgi:two-component system alkaline phosphatase synthesis response regulator PhoP
MQSFAQLAAQGGHKILIVEDHRDSREAMRALFEAVGYEVFEAGNGREGIEAADRERPHLILMDIMMPELDGLTASRRIRNIDGMEKTPIIAITAMEDARELALQAGMSDYVRKPVDIRGLITKVSGLLQPTVA